MVFIWRGSGITVPIFLFISGWIMSFWYPDTRLGNYPFVGWSMLWAGILLTLQGAAVWGGGTPDPETGEVPLRRGHDFFWIPVLFWGIGFIGLSIWLINKEPKESFYTSPDYEQIIENLPGSEEEEEEIRRVNFYNPFQDTIYIELYEAKTKDRIIGFDVPPSDWRYNDLDLGRYDVVLGDETRRITVGKSENRYVDDYDEAWYIMGGAADLLLVDVTDACDGEITRGDIRDIDWTEQISEHYDGDDLIVPLAKSTPRKQKFIYRIEEKLPLEHKKKEAVYALILIGDDVEPSDEYLDEKVIRLCFKDDE